MTRYLFVASVLAVAACMQIGTQTGTEGSGSTTTDAGTSVSDGATSGFAECGTDPTTGVILCLQTAACPGGTVDTSAFPNCGFRQGGSSAYDLECLCNGTYLCPLGSPTSCSDLGTLLSQEQSALQVCQQVATGSCISLGGTGSSSGSSSGGSTSSSSGSATSSSGSSTTLSSACMTCIAGCGATPACYQSCGC